MHILFDQSWFTLRNEIRKLALRIPLQSGMWHFLESGIHWARMQECRIDNTKDSWVVSDKICKWQWPELVLLSLQEWTAPANRCFNENRCSATRFGSLPFNPFILWVPLTFMDVILSSTFFKVYLKIWESGVVLRW